MENSTHILYSILQDRLALLRQMDAEGDSPRRRHIAKETNELHAPLAHRLGLYQIKTEMEDLSLKFTDYDTYKYIAHALNEKRSERDAYIERFIAPLQEKLTAEGYTFAIKGRPKSIHSIAHKMQVQHCDVDHIYDLFAIRIILDSPEEREKQDCWQVYSLITDIFPPNPKRLRDWLSVPKSNGYESLHTTVLGPDNRWVEVQIRSRRMDEVAEQGVAAHWAYKGVSEHQSRINDQAVYVFTPTGDLKRLPAGATVLDFAFFVHTEVGRHCTGARIQGRMVPIRHPLENGDQIEILTSTTQHPTLDWLSAVVSHRAKNKIRQYLNEQEAKAEEANLDKRETKLEEIPPTHEPKIRRPSIPMGVPQESKPMMLEVTDLHGVDLHPASCCNPQPGDPIFGFVSVTKGIRIHRMDCPNAAFMHSNYPYRIIPAKWTEKVKQ